MSAMSARTKLSGGSHAAAGTAAGPASRVRSAAASAPTAPPVQSALAPPAPVLTPPTRTPNLTPPASTVPQSTPVRSQPAPVLAQRRAERRAALKLARRSQQRWAIAGCAILAAAFGLTVGILDVLH